MLYERQSNDFLLEAESYILERESEVGHPLVCGRE